MVKIKKKIIGNQSYYYLEHSTRENKEVKKYELYLGKRIPKDIDRIKNDFIYSIYKSKWFEKFDKIKQNYQKERRMIPASILSKNIEDFTIKFTYDTNRIEGSKLTLRETAMLLQEGVTPKKPLSDVKEAENHNKVFYTMLSHKKDLSLQILLYWHKLLFEDTKPDIAGKIRNYQVAIAGSRFMPPSPAEVEVLLREFFKWYDSNKRKMHPVELAALVHIKLVSIHLFGDGNGRISRLAMNFILNRYGFPMLNIEYKNRNSYYSALERAQTKKNDLIFLNWFFKKYLKENHKYLEYSKRIAIS